MLPCVRRNQLNYQKMKIKTTDCEDGFLRLHLIGSKETLTAKRIVLKQRVKSFFTHSFTTLFCLCVLFTKIERVN